MGRWEPDAPGRLQQAALELYVELGYDQTTVAMIAERAGVTERTFFRHFADKREVLFMGAEAFEALFVTAVTEAPADVAPMAAIARSLAAAGAEMQTRSAFAVKRSAAVAASAELQARELVKMAALSSALTEALRGRGVPEGTARLAAETGVAVFRVGFQRWIAGRCRQDLAGLLAEALAELRELSA